MENVKDIRCVAVVGHIDHGKSTLLEALSGIPLQKEVGDITQSIYVFPVKSKEGVAFSFLDTPGHAIFSDIRARAIDASDVAVLVVSAEEGVKEQTKESFKLLSESSTPFIVALTKVDSSNTDIHKTKTSLSEAHIFVEGMGGDIPVVEVSAKKKKGLDALLELLNLLSETSTKKEKEGEGIVLDIEKEKGGRVKTLILVTKKTTQKGGYIATKSGAATTIQDAQGKTKDTYFSGEIISTYGLADARLGEVCSFYATKKEIPVPATQPPTLQPIVRKRKEKQSTCIIKAKHMSTLQAIEDDIQRKEIPIRIVKQETGEVTEKDVQLAITTESFILAFAVKTDKHADHLATQNNIPIHTTDIIYTAMEIIEKEHNVFTTKNTKKDIQGDAKIIRIFKNGIYGARIQKGTFEVHKKVYVLRAGKKIGEGTIQSIQQKNTDCESVEGEKTEFAFSAEINCTIELGDTLQQIEIS